MKQLVKGVFLLMIGVYLIFGLFGYLTFYKSEAVSELTYLALFNGNSSLIIMAQTFMLLTCIVAYIFLFKPTRDLIESYILGGLISENKEKEFGIQNLFITFWIKAVIVFSIYFLLKYQISFITLIDNISELIFPWIFVLIPIYAFIQASKQKAYYVVLLITLGFFVSTLVDKASGLWPRN